MPTKDESGARYHGLLVTGRAPSKRQVARWACRCDCGAKVEVNGIDLRRGHVRSCGCLRPPPPGRPPSTGMRRRDVPGYQSWHNMIQRCLNPAAPSFMRYGARGVTVCEQWRNFSAFLADMGPRPPGHSIDRIDNDGNYEPGNCRWATAVQQGRNKRGLRFTEGIAAEVRRRVAAGESQSAVARDLGADGSVISRVVHGTRWAET